MPAAKARKSRRAPKTERISELSAGPIGGEIDEATHTITNVAVLGRVSLNGRKYSRKALTDAAQVFEGTRVFLDHREVTDRGRVKPHRTKDYVGRLEGLFVEGDRVRAQRFRVYNQGHWPLVVSARQDPGAFGFSIDGEGAVVKGEVTKIVAGHSVDLVSAPATTRGLFENKEADVNWDNVTREDLEENAGELIQELREEATGELKTKLDEALGEIKKLKESAGGGSSEKGDKGESVQEQIDSLKRELQEANRDRSIERTLREARITDAPEELLEALRAVSSDEKRAKIVELFAERAPAGDSDGDAADRAKRPKSRPRLREGSGSGGSLKDDSTVSDLQEAWAGDDSLLD